MRAYVATTGSHGDVHPFLALGRTLVQRGHEVLLFVHPYFDADASKAGIATRPLSAGLDIEALLRDPDLSHPTKGSRRLVPMMLEEASKDIESMRRAIDAEPPDVLVAHHVCMSTRWIAKQFQIPFANVILAPMMWFNPADSIAALQRREGAFPRSCAKWLAYLTQPLVSAAGDRYLNALRRRAGLAPERGCLQQSLVGGDLNLGLWSPYLRGPLPGDPPTSRICGFAWHDGSHGTSSLDARLTRFMEDGEPPIVFTLGTAAVHKAGNFFEIAAETCRRLGRRGVLLVGSNGRVPSGLPNSIVAHDYAPFSKLLPRAAAVVQHGGIGSLAQSLRAGCPSVQVAHAYDQFNNALRAVELGVGAMLSRARLNPTRLSQALCRVLDDPEVRNRARCLAERIQREDGAPTAVDHIEHLVATHSGRPCTGGR